MGELVAAVAVPRGTLCPSWLWRGKEAGAGRRGSTSFYNSPLSQRTDKMPPCRRGAFPLDCPRAMGEGIQ